MTRCTYWERQEMRHIDETGFGMSPWALMTPAQAERAQARQEREDEADPPCESCETCRASASEGIP